MNDPLPNETPLMPNSRVPQNVQGSYINPMMVNNYKTVVCKYWEQGKCKYVTNCSFAHGDTEQRKAGANNMNGYDPLKDPNIEYMMKVQQ
jgi:hypothetical protein